MLFGAWLHFENAPALRWWAAANVLNGLALAVIVVGLASDRPPVVMVGVGLNTLAPALLWGGLRRFYGLSAPLALLVCGTLVWMVVGLAPLAIGHQRWATLAGFAGWATYLLASAWILWCGREENLRARLPLAGFLAVHAILFLGAACEILLGVFPLDEPARLNSFFGAIHFETIVYAMTTATFMVLMCKERVEIAYRREARTDALTGVANRGSLFETSQRLFDRCCQDGRPFSLIMFDLDHFKTINDGFGHQVGDRLLGDFADTARNALRPSDLVGRYGGEEFMVVLPGRTVEIAQVIAERVRQAFAESHRLMDDRPLNATVSAGVATALPGSTLEALIEAADKALYVAKESGRNRIHSAGDGRRAHDDNIIRIA
jgi:diguanylate cyclase (GGDEF)-like protein